MTAGSPYGRDPGGGSPYGGFPYGAPPYGWPQYGAPPHGGPPYGWAPYGWLPYGSGPPPPFEKPLPHETPRTHAHVMRSRTWEWWRPLLGLLLFGGAYAVSSVLSTIVVLVALLPTGYGWIRGLGEGANLVDPRVLLVTNASLVVAIPVVWLVWATVHHMAIGWSASVLGRLRWRLFLPWSVLAAACLGGGIALSLILALASGEQVSGPTPSFAWLVLVVVLTTPLQSAAEEYIFRGYLSQAVAGWFRSERTGAVVAALGTATLFSLVHLPPDWPTFLDRFAVGLAASAVVWLTGGLEAAISLHAVNNVLVFLLAGALGGGLLAEGESGEGLIDLLVTVLALGAYVALVAAARRRLRPETRTAAQQLPPPVPPWPWWPVPSAGQFPAAQFPAAQFPTGPFSAGHGGPGGSPPGPAESGIVSPWRREAPNDPWGMG